jgi:hypothetical protein
MNLLTLRRFAVQVLVVVVALAAVLTSGAPAQSLGDLARKDQGRPKSGTAKVYTNDDLKGSPAPAATSPAPATAAPADDSKAAPRPDAKAADGSVKTGDAKADGKTDAKADAKADGKPKDPKSDAADWRKRVQEIQASIDRSKLFADSLQSRINGLTADFSARDDPAQRSQVATDRQKALTELDRVKKDIELQTKALADLQEDARKSGVPPGWLR